MTQPSTEIIAWAGLITGIIGAFTGIFAVCLDAWRWARSGPRIIVSASGGVRLTNKSIISAAGTTSYIMITVQNTGDRATTITGLYLGRFANRWQRLRNKPQDVFFVPSPGSLTNQDLPYKIDPGCEWTGLTPQTPELLEWIKKKEIHIMSICVDGSYKSRVRIGNEGEKV